MVPSPAHSTPSTSVSASTAPARGSSRARMATTGARSYDQPGGSWVNTLAPPSVPPQHLRDGPEGGRHQLAEKPWSGSGEPVRQRLLDDPAELAQQLVAEVR